MSAIWNKRRGLFHFHLATLLLAQILVAALIFLNVYTVSERPNWVSQYFGGWPFKFIRYWPPGYWPPGYTVDAKIYPSKDTKMHYRDIPQIRPLVANILVWITFLMPVALVEWRCRGGSFGAVRRFLRNIHWGALPVAGGVAVTMLCANLIAERKSGITYYGWPSTFVVLDRPVFVYESCYLGFRDLVLNAYLTVFLSGVSLILANIYFKHRQRSAALT